MNMQNEIIGLQNNAIKKLEEIIALQKKIIQDKDEIIELQRSVINLSEKKTSETIKSLRLKVLGAMS